MTYANQLFVGSVASGATLYVEVPVRGEPDSAARYLGVQIGWLDATSSATIALELSSFDGAAAVVAGAAWEWKDSGLTITGPTAAAASSTILEVENVRQHRARLKIIAAAACNFDIRDGTSP